MFMPVTFLTIFMVITSTDAQKGQKFLLAFSPRYNKPSNGACDIIINANTPAEVNITFNDNLYHRAVDTDSYIFSIDCTIQVGNGYSSKGILVESNVDISVQVVNDDGAGRGDAYLALPSSNGGSEHVLATPGQCMHNVPYKSVFTVAAEMDGTHIEVFAPATGGYDLVDTIELDSFGTYTNRSANDNGTDFTGWKLRSDKPVSVITGSACITIGCGHTNAGYMFSPPTDQTGYHFIVPKISNETPGISGFYIRVISFSQSNNIQLPEQSISENLQSGEVYEYHADEWDEVVRVDCQKRCLVVLFNSLSDCSASEGNFLIYVTPLEFGTDYVQFTAIEHTDASSYFYDNFVTIIATTQSVQLDNGHITGWRYIQSWNYFEVTLQIAHGSHYLQTNDGGEFVAFVYGHTQGYPYGYGSAIVHSVQTEHPLPGETPTFRISLISDWSSDIIMEASCVTQYSNQIRQKTLLMAMDLDNMLGDSLCTSHHKEDLSITSSSSSFFSSTNTGIAFVSFIFSPASHITMGAVLLCADKIAAYAKPHLTWGIPLLDIVPNCADPVFHDEVFYEGEHEWICENEKEYEETPSLPSIFIELRDVGTTTDNSDLNPECTIRFSISLDNRALTMRSVLDTLIGNLLCPGIDGVGFSSPQTSLTTQGISALVHINYILTFESEASPRDALSCAEEVRQYLLSYDSWGVPLLPPESGCPNIDFTGTRFQESSLGWLCNL